MVDFLQNRKNNARYLVALGTANLFVAHSVVANSTLEVYGLQISVDVASSSIKVLLGFFLLWDILHLAYDGLDHRNRWLGQKISKAHDALGADPNEPNPNTTDSMYGEYEISVFDKLTRSRNIQMKAKNSIELLIAVVGPIAPVGYGLLAFLAPNPVTDLVF